MTLDLLKLNRNLTRWNYSPPESSNWNTYYPLELVQSWTSLIWTERYLDPGDFELRTPKIAETMAQLPLGSLVAIKNSDEVCIVETHSIEPAAEGGWELLVRGPSLTNFMKHRVLRAGNVDKPKTKMAGQYSPAEAAAIMLLYCFTSTSHILSSHSTGTPTGKTIGNLIITASLPSAEWTFNRKRRWYNEGLADAEIMKFLSRRDLGIRVIRPRESGRTLNKVSTSGTSTVTVSRTTTTGVTEMAFDIFKGTDRTINQTAVAPVTFRVDADHMKDPKYMFSIETLKTMVQASYWDFPVWETLDDEYGLNARYSYYQAGQYDPADDFTEFYEDTKDQAQGETRKSNPEVRSVDAQLGAKIPYLYKQHYDLGDKITLMGEYGVQQTMQVTEYIRHATPKGVVGYPTLSYVGPEE